MLEKEREALLEKMKAATQEARGMTQDEARKRLQDAGLCDERGRLTADYGGKSARRA